MWYRSRLLPIELIAIGSSTNLEFVDQLIALHLGCDTVTTGIVSVVGRLPPGAGFSITPPAFVRRLKIKRM